MIFTKEKYLQAKRESKDVLQETGFTPRQLAEQKVELLKQFTKVIEVVKDGSINADHIASSESLIKLAK